MELKTCNFIEASDIYELLGTEEAEALMEVVSNSEISFGSNNRTMVSTGSFYGFIEDALPEDRAESLIEELRKILGPHDYIDVEN